MHPVLKHSIQARRKDCGLEGLEIRKKGRNRLFMGQCIVQRKQTHSSDFLLQALPDALETIQHLVANSHL